MRSKQLSFTNKHGEQLSARLDMPANGKPLACALFAHCFTCSKDLKAVRNIARGLNQDGLAVMRFDFTGLGQSEGDFADTGFSSNVQDLITAAEFMEEMIQAPSLLIGHSLGGAAVLCAAHSIESVQAVVTIGAPAEPVHVTHLIGDKKEELVEKGHATVNIGGRPFELKQQFVDDLEQYNLAERISSLRKPLLIFHSPQDLTVGIDNAAQIYTAAHHPKSFISLDGADHLLSKSQDARYVGQAIASWVSRYLDLEPAQEDELDSHLQAAARVNNEPGFLTDVIAGKHALLADEPISVGGEDLGPTPYDLLSASLATCSAMTMKMYAQRKGWPLEEALVHVRHERQHFEDCEPDSNKFVDNFKKEIELQGPLDEKQRARLKEIASRCPVHRTLLNEITIDTELLNEH